MLSKLLDTRGDWAQLPIRLIVGVGFLAHGIAKFSHGIDKFAANLSALGVPAPHVAAVVTSVIELVGGVCVIAGAFVIPLSVPLIAIMMTAMFTVHLQYGFSSIKLMSVSASGAQFGPPGVELNMLYIAAMISIVIGGPGKLSFDSYRRAAKRPSFDRRSASSGSKL
jgi:putative oxidoreductase